MCVCVGHDGDVYACMCRKFENNRDAEKEIVFFFLKYRSLMLIESLQLVFAYMQMLAGPSGENVYIYALLT